MTTPHTPIRPLWICRNCAGPWPCGAARLQLFREFADDRIGLCVYLASQLEHALVDLCPTPPALIHGRILGWVPPMDSYRPRLRNRDERLP
ncbi:hypothetical protein GCM10027280_25580 [Micromonospora polyrhachis]|uniref:Flavin reductase n=1 Tax=Micromonospora polyrhachis TaxID=1282883 RepID=A0A7W7WQT6_9ACTN|nr:hypothetical protein [Micromonospora polyrhachis]